MQGIERQVILVLKDQDGLDVSVHALAIITSLPEDKIIPAIMAASEQFLLTPEGKEVYEDNGHAFNYGDFMLHVGNSFCIPNGFARVDIAPGIIEDDFNVQLATLEVERAFTIEVGSVSTFVTKEGIDDILDTAMSACSYWCRNAEPVGGYLGDHANEQISRGGTLMFYPIGAKPVELDFVKFQHGVCRWVSPLVESYRDRYLMPDGQLDAGQVDGDEADCILQYALFDEIRYS